eukprot:scaffold3808_cov112-Isochrysis_galbana.AAC.28
MILVPVNLEADFFQLSSGNNGSRITTRTGLGSETPTVHTPAPVTAIHPKPGSTRSTATSFQPRPATRTSCSSNSPSAARRSEDAGGVSIPPTCLASISSTLSVLVGWTVTALAR